MHNSKVSRSIIHTLQPGLPYAQRHNKATARTLQLQRVVHAVLYAVSWDLASSADGISKGRSVIAKLRIGYRS